MVADVLLLLLCTGGVVQGVEVDVLRSGDWRGGIPSSAVLLVRVGRQSVVVVVGMGWVAERRGKVVQGHHLQVVHGVVHLGTCCAGGGQVEAAVHLSHLGLDGLELKMRHSPLYSLLLLLMARHKNQK